MYSLKIFKIISPKTTEEIKIWLKNNRIHREKGPAVLEFDEKNNLKKQTYYVNNHSYVIENDTLFRTRELLTTSEEGEPSVIYLNGTKEWHDYGCLHRHQLPAIEYSNGDYEYWNFGKRHRLGGEPAVQIGNRKYWFIDGEFIKCTN
jgi:hypothetical protein